MSNALDYCWHEKGSDVLELACDEHARDSNQMQLLEEQGFFSLQNEAIHVLDCKKEGLLAHFEGIEHFVHPVDHACSPDLGNPMPAQVSDIYARLALICLSGQQVSCGIMNLLRPS